MVGVDDESVAKMSGGDVDVEPSLSFRNALGNGNRNSNYQNKECQNFQSLVVGKRWWYAEV